MSRESGTKLTEIELYALGAAGAKVQAAQHEAAALVAQVKAAHGLPLEAKIKIEDGTMFLIEEEAK